MEMQRAIKQDLLIPSRRLIAPQRRRLYRSALPGLAPVAFKGREVIIPGSVGYGAGTYNFFIPNCNTLVIDLYAPGGGGGGAGGYQGQPLPGTPGGAGGYVRVYYYGSGIAFDLVAYGGGGGPATNYDNYGGPLSGEHGTAVGGDINTTAGGSAGGVYGLVSSFAGFVIYGSYGGYGARCAKTITGLGGYQGAAVTVIVGSPGPAGANNVDGFSTNAQNPSAGNGGAAYISWS